MKLRKFLSILLLAVVALCFVACGKDNNKPVDNTEITEKANEYLNKIAITYAAGDSATSVTKDVTLGTATAEGLTVTWASNNAAITKEGKVTQGDADVNVKLTVTIKYKDVTLTKDFNLVVKAKVADVVEPVAVEVTGAEKVTVGANIQLTAAVKPDNATAKEVEWSTDDATIATVDATGKVTGVKAGTAKITATVKGYAAVKAEYTVTVEEEKEPEPETIAATLAKEKGAQGWIKGTVVGTYKRGFMVYDGTGYILVYMNTTEFTQAVGDFVEVKGELGEYNGAKQFTDSCTLTALTEGTPYKLTATALDDAGVKALIASFEYAKKIKVRVTIDSASDSYVNATVKGGESGIAITYPLDKDAYEVGADYDVTGLALYTKEYNGKTSVYVMVEKATKVDYGFDVNITYKDGESQEVVKVNSLEFPLFELKEPEEKEGYVFRGWYKGTLEAPVKVTSLLLPEDIELFAIWCTPEEAPLVVDITAEEGSGMYSSISAALKAAKPGQTIELLAGDYTETTIIPADPAVEGSQDQEIEQIIIDKPVKIIGPNANVHGHSEDRADEANITVKFIVAADFVEVDGLAFVQNGIFEIRGAKHTLINNCAFQTDVFGNTGVNNRKASIYNNGYVEDVVILNTSIIFPGTSYVNEAIEFDNDGITDFTMDNCYLENTATTLAVYEALMTYNIMGVFNLTNNETHFASDGYLFRFGFNNTSCSQINIIDNKFLPLGDLQTVTIGFASMDARKGMEINIIGNEFVNFAPSTFTFAGGNAGGAVINYYYNYFDAQQTWKVATLPTDVVFNHDNNCTLAEYNSANTVLVKEETNGYADKDALDAAYAAYKATLKTVKFDVDGGFYKAPITFTNAEEVVLPTAAKYGYAFMGWYDGETKVTSLSANADVTLKAKWAKTYTITFDADGGKEVADIVYADVNDVELPTTTKEGFMLEGWYKVSKLYDDPAACGAAFAADFKTVTGKNIDSGEKVDTNYVDSIDMVTFGNNADMKAKWAWLYNAILEATGNPDGMDIVNGEASDSNKGFWLANLCGFFTGTQHKDTYLGTDSADFSTLQAEVWAKCPAGEGLGAKVEAITELANLELKAKWEVPATITLDVDGGEAIEAIKFIDPAKVVLPTPVKEGYYFLGWKDGENDAQVTEKKDYTFKATWRAVSTLEVGEGKTYATIADALAAAQPGDIISIAKGTYAETPEVTVADLTIQGAKAYEFGHKDTYAASAEEDTIINAKFTVKANGVTIKNVALGNDGYINVTGAKDLTVESVFSTTTSVAGAVLMSGDNFNITVKGLYFAGASNRIVYVTTGATTGLTVEKLIVMDAATVTMDSNGKYSAGVCDAIRSGMNNTANLFGDVLIKDCYLRAGQGGFMDRVPSADKYEIVNCYFYQIPAAIYMRSATTTIATTYIYEYNTFVECGNSINDWDTITATTNDLSTVEIHYNAFVDSFKYAGTYTDYDIKVRKDLGAINCSKNFFKNDKDIPNLNAKGLTKIEINAEDVVMADKEYDLYTITKQNGKVLVFGLNWICQRATVKLDDAEAIPVTLATYELPTPTKEGYEFQGWFEGETKVTKLTEVKDYVLVSQWKKLSVYNGLEGADVSNFYPNREMFIEELIKDFNTYKNTAYTKDTLPTGAWTIVGFHDFFLTAPYSAKYKPLLQYLATTESGASCNAHVNQILASIDAGYTTATQNADWNTSQSPYGFQYEIMGFILGQKFTAHSSADYHSADYSVEATATGFLASYLPTKEGKVFAGWYTDEALTQAVEGQLAKYDGVYYAKWEDAPSA